MASTETLIEPSSVTPRITSTRRSCQKRATDVGRTAGNAHCAETASRRFEVHQIPDHSAASSPRPATALRCATASSMNGMTASDSAPGTAAVIASRRSSSSVGLSHSTNPAAPNATMSSGTAVSTLKNVTAAAKWLPRCWKYRSPVRERWSSHSYRARTPAIPALSRLRRATTASTTGTATGHLPVRLAAPGIRRAAAQPASPCPAVRRADMLAVMTEDRASAHRRLGRWLYPGGRPNRLARALNRLSVLQVGAGLLPERVVTLEVPGRVSGRTVSFPLVAVEQDGATYLVAMLGHRTNWVRNVAANGGRAVLRRRRGGPVDVELREVDVADRAPILRRFLALAPGARPHVAVDRHAPLAEFARIAPDHPVFEVVKKV